VTHVALYAIVHADRTCLYALEALVYISLHLNLTSLKFRTNTY